MAIPRARCVGYTSNRAKAVALAEANTPAVIDTDETGWYEVWALSYDEPAHERAMLDPHLELWED